MTKDEKSQARLEYWKPIVRRDENAWAAVREPMDWREELYAGTHKMKPVIEADRLHPVDECWHVRNVVAENIETMVDSRIPKPKVIPMRKENEKLARTLEHALLFYTRRRHLRTLNDLAERMVPIQGGCAYFVEWDHAVKTPDGMGDVQITLIHPKQLVPQAGIYTDIEDMDHVAVKLALTRQQVLARFGVDPSELSEDDPTVRGKDDEASSEAELITVYLLYYRNTSGGIGMLAWCDDTVLADRENCQARRMRRCRQCGALDAYIDLGHGGRAEGGRAVLAPTEADEGRDTEEEFELAGIDEEGPRRCLWCEGTEFEEVEVDEEEVMTPRTIMTTTGQEIKLQGAMAWKDEQGRFQMEVQSFIPYYRPNRFPIVLQKNISKFGQLLGESDVDKMADQQNTIKRLDKKILDRILKAGTKISLPPSVNIETNTADSETFRLTNPADLQMIQTFEFTGDISPEKLLSDRVYEEARQGAGITDSMQGRRDPTATSGAAKEFAAGRSEGRMQSRRVMKQEAWAKIYELIAKMLLAYADGPRRVRVENTAAEVDYEEFNREDFLQIDQEGNMFYEDGFIFETDDATSLGEDRESMWQEITRSFSAGTLGDPTQLTTLVLYWGLMEEQGYPGAQLVKKKLEEQLETQQMQMQQMQQVQAQPTVPEQAGAGIPEAGAVDPMAMQGGGMM